MSSTCGSAPDPRNSVQVTSRAPAEVPPTTTTSSTPGHDCSASRTCGSIPTALPRRTVPSAVITAFASASWIREAIAPGPKPENSGTAIAPTLATAYSATTASGVIGRWIATASPRPMPCARSPVRALATWSSSSAYVSLRTVPSSASCTTATASGVRRAQRVSVASTTLMRPPGNQSGWAMPRRMSSTCSYGVRNSMPRSAVTVSQKLATSATERARSSSAVVVPSVRMRRATLEFSRWSGDGCQV